MSASLVGSEMCIRDRINMLDGHKNTIPGDPKIAPGGSHDPVSLQQPRPVSYTHLTLPTICSV
eukprot:11351131-Alexandrium_andersonii.AAC.1